MYSAILLAADGSENSVRAAREAARLANSFDESVITIVYVTDFNPSKESLLYTDSREAAPRKKLLLPIERVLQEYDAPYQTEFLHGDPAHELVEYAHRRAMDIIVIGSRGRNAFQEMILGSVSQKVMKRVTCPVLLVK